MGLKSLRGVNDYRFGILTLPTFNGTIADLKGKKIGAAFGAASFARVLDKLKSVGFNEPMQDFQLINLDASEMVNALQSKAIDAIVIWDPSLEKLISSGTAKAVWISEVGDQQGQGWLGFSGEFIKKNGEESVVRFLKAFITATWWASNHSADARKWFAETSRVTPDLLAAADSADRNLKKPLPQISDVNFKLSDADVAEVQGIMDTMVKLKLVQTSPDVSKFVDPKYLALAQKEMAEGKMPDLSKIQIMLP